MYNLRLLNDFCGTTALRIVLLGGAVGEAFSCTIYLVTTLLISPLGGAVGTRDVHAALVALRARLAARARPCVEHQELRVGRLVQQLEPTNPEAVVT